MTEPTRLPVDKHRRASLAVAVLLVVLMLAGCGTVSGGGAASSAPSAAVASPAPEPSPSPTAPPSPGPSPSPTPWRQRLSPSSLPSLQINVDGDYARAWIFADMLRGSECWVAKVPAVWNAPGFTDAEAIATAAALQVDAHGWPTLPTGTSMTIPVGGYRTGKAVNPDTGQNEDTYLHGVFVLTWKGTGTVYMGYDQSHGRALLTSPNRIVYQVDTAFGGQNVYVTSSDPSNPVRDVRLWAPASDGAGRDLTASSDLAPGHVAGSLEPSPGTPEPLFHPRYLAHIAEIPDAGVLRFMGWLQINTGEGDLASGGPIGWDERGHPDRGVGALYVLSDGYVRHRVAGFCGGRLGYPYEWLIELSNLTGKDLWLQVPHNATPEMIASLARLVAQRLSPQRRVWFEYSNEIWNSGVAYLPQFNHAKAVAAQHFGVDPSAVTSDQQAWGNGHCQGLALQGFEGAWRAAGQSDERLVNVVSGWTISPAYNRSVLDAVREVDPALPEVLAITNYVGEWIQNDLWAAYAFGSNPGAWPASLFDDMLRIQERSLWSIADAWTACGALAREQGLALVAYEGGEGLGYFAYGNDSTPEGRDFIDFMHAFKYSPQMRVLYREMYAFWSAAGGRTASQFTDCGTWSFWGDWGTKEYVVQTRADSVKWDAVCAWGELQRGIRAPGEAIGSAPVLQSVALRGEAGIPFDCNVTASGGDGTVSMALLGGRLPAGLSLQVTGSGQARIAGTPTQSGAFHFVLRAVDADGDACDRPQEMVVAPEGVSTHAMVLFRGADLPVSQGGQGRYDSYGATQLLDGGTRLMLPFEPDTPLFEKDAAAQWGFEGYTLDPTSPLTMYGAWSVTSVDSAHGLSRTGPPHPQQWIGLRDGQYVSFTGDPNGPSVTEALCLWKKPQFAAMGGVGSYAFGTSAVTATLQVTITRLMADGSGSDNEARFVVVNRESGVDKWYISEASWTSSTVPQDSFTLSDFTQSSAAGKRWSAMAAPSGTDFHFPTSGLLFGPRQFDDVQAVGVFYRGAGYGGTFAFSQFIALGERR